MTSMGVELSGSVTMGAYSSATIRVDYQFSSQFVAGALLLAKRALVIERRKRIAGLLQAEHRALVVAAIMQSAASIESALWEVVDRWYEGPPSAWPESTKHVLMVLRPPMPDLVDKVPNPLNRWQTVLELLGRQKMDVGRNPFQDAALLVDLRNELVHYHPQWNGATSKPSLIQRLRTKRFAAPTFADPGDLEFPHRVLSAHCAEWAGRTAESFLDASYDALGMPRLLDGHRVKGAVFRDLLVKKKKAAARRSRK